MKKLRTILAAGSLLLISLICTAIPVAAKTRYTVRVRGGSMPWYGYLILVAIFVAVGIGSTFTVKKVSKTKKLTNRPKDYTAQIINEAIQVDPNFGSEQLTSRARKAFELLTEAIPNRDLSALREMESQELFNRQNAEIESLISQGQIHMLSNATIQHAYLHLYRRDKNFEYITVCVTATMKDYFIDQNSYQVLQGDKSKMLTRHYLFTYMRSKSFPQNLPTANQPVKCPNCGAPLIMNSSRLCEYCHSVIRAELFDWVLNDVEVLGEKDMPDNRGVLLEDNADVHFTKQNSSYYTGYYDNGIDYNYKDPFEDDDYNKSF